MDVEKEKKNKTKCKVLLIVQSLNGYERVTAICAVLLIIGAFVAWRLDERNITSAVEIAQTLFIGLGALSILLVWAQTRLANKQDKQLAAWRRIDFLHRHFSEVPKHGRSDAMRVYLAEHGITSPPSVYVPLPLDVAVRICEDSGTNSRPPGRDIAVAYLNDWEDFCAAVQVGAIDEEYARELEGSRVIDAFFGYRAFIDEERRRYDQKAVRDGDAGENTPYKCKFYLELQTLAVNWYGKRRHEQARQDNRMKTAKSAADAAERRVLDGDPPIGVRPKVRNDYEG